MIVQIVRYLSRLPHEEIRKRFEARSDRYREVPGLIQKFYVRFPATGEYGGIYVWDTKESLEAWTAGNLAGTLAETYQVDGDPDRELAEVMLILRPSTEPLPVESV